MLLSICIPCFKRSNEVIKTIESIYYDNSDVAIDEFEVVISDNDPDCEIKNVIGKFKYSNLRYYSTKCEGFMNSYYVLTYAKGDFLKLHNSQSVFRKGAIREIIQNIKDTKVIKPIWFYTNGMLNRLKILSFDDYNQFMSKLSYWSSWSNGFCIWKEDFSKIREIKLNKLFPHTSLFLAQRDSNLYFINDYNLFEVQRVPKRGGHNKFEAFSVEYPSLIDKSYTDNQITKKVRNEIFRGLVTQMLPTLLFNKYIAKIESFEITGFRQNMKIYFSLPLYYLTYVLSPFVPVYKVYNRLVKFFHNIHK